MLCITWIRLSYRTVFRTLSLGTDLSRYFIRDRVRIRNMTQIPQSAPHVLILLFSDYCRIFLGLLSSCQRYSLLEDSMNFLMLSSKEIPNLVRIVLEILRLLLRKINSKFVCDNKANMVIYIAVQIDVNISHLICQLCITCQALCH